MPSADRDLPRPADLLGRARGRLRGALGGAVRRALALGYALVGEEHLARARALLAADARDHGLPARVAPPVPGSCAPPAALGPDPSPPASDRPAPPPTPAARRRPRVAPSDLHDVDAPAVPVTVHQGVIDRLFADYAAHVAGARGDEETGWVPIGRPAPDGGLVVTGLLPAGPRSRATPTAFEIDHAFVFAALLLARSVRGGDGVVGLWHSHPGDMDFNSGVDLGTDRSHVRALAGRVGLYPIVVREVPRARGHTLRCGARVAFWVLRADRPGTYVRGHPTVVEGNDEAAWLAGHVPALERLADAALALGQAGLSVSVRAVDGRGALDLVARRGSLAAVRRYAPEPGDLLLVSPAGRSRLLDPPGDPRRLAQRVLAALDAPPGRAGSPRAEPAAGAPASVEPAMPPGGRAILLGAPAQAGRRRRPRACHGKKESGR